MPAPPYAPPPPDVAPLLPRRVVRLCEPQAWFEADYLLWWTKQANVPALVTSAVDPSAGVLGPADSQTLFDGGKVGDAESGGRFTLGFWLFDAKSVGVEASYFFLERCSIPVAGGTEPSNQDGAPDGIFAVWQSSFLQGAQIGAIVAIDKSSHYHLNLLGGFRFLELRETLSAEQSFLSADGAEVDTWEDKFKTRNDFYGGYLGARGEWCYDRLFASVSGQVALGAAQQKVSIGGGLTQAVTTATTDSFGNVIASTQVSQSPIGGLLANPAASSRDVFAVVPELSLDIGYRFTGLFRASFGYDFLFWSNVARPGDQVTSVGKTTDFWAQGLHLRLGCDF
jgi:hypothetical protein